jgi:hypothetical protein
MTETRRCETFSPNYPEFVDHVGITQTVALAKERFGQLEQQHFSLWAAAEDPRSNQITCRLQQILELVEDEVSATWGAGGEWYSGWFERACRPKIHEALGTRIKEGISRARALEIERLEKPDLSLVELLGSGGDTTVAVLLQPGQQALERSKAITNGLAASHTPRSEPAHDPVQARISSARARAQAQPSTVGTSGNGAAQPAPRGWEDIEIRFLSDERVQIFVRGRPSDTKNFAEMGFEDLRGKGGKPKQAWHLLQVLSQNRGMVPATAIFGHQDIQKRAQELRDVLCDHFHIADNPLPYLEGTGYKTRFKIERSPACNT